MQREIIPSGLMSSSFFIKLQVQKCSEKKGFSQKVKRIRVLK